MTIATPGVRLKWERNLPEIAPPWTHWRILGDGETLADVPGHDLLGALRIVENNFDKYRRILATRLRYDGTGQCLVDDRALFAITRK